MSVSREELQALLSLLADDHPEIVEAARAKLIQWGDQVVPLLKEWANTHEEPKVRVEIAGVLERIRLAEVGKEWEGFSRTAETEADLEAGAFLLAKVGTPDLDLPDCQGRLDALAERIRVKLARVRKPLSRLEIMNQTLFEEERFRGNRQDYFDPQNSYLNRVLDRKLGIPISLSVLYLLVGWRLKLPLQGAGIPGHFMVKYADPQGELYIDTFNEGRFLSRPECVQWIVESGYPYQVDFLEAVGPREILGRMLRNLILIYMERREETLERVLTRFLNVLDPTA